MSKLKKDAGRKIYAAIAAFFIIVGMLAFLTPSGANSPEEGLSVPSFAQHQELEQRVADLESSVDDLNDRVDVLENPAEPEPTDDPTTDPDPEVNLLSATQQDFEDGIAGWIPAGNVLLGQSSDKAATESKSLELDVNTAGPFQDSTRTARAGTTAGQSGVPVEVGESYSARLQVLSGQSENSQARAEVRWYRSNGGILSTHFGDFASIDDEWTEVSTEAVAPADAATAAVRVYITEADYGEQFYIDDAWLIGGASDDPTTEPPEDPDPTEDPEPGEITHGSQLTLAHVGPSGSLTPSGSISTTQNGQVIENVEVTGRIQVQHQNVVIRNVRVLATGRYGVEIPLSLNSTASFTMEQSEIRGVSGDRSACIVHYGSWTIKRVLISNCIDGAKITSNNHIIESMIVEPFYKPSGSHNDGIQSVGGSNSSVVRSRIEGPFQGQTSALILSSDVSHLSNYRLEDNLFKGGNYTLYIRNKPGMSPPSNMIVRNNIWIADSWQFGPTSLNVGPGWTWVNNRTHTGSPINCGSC